MVGEAARADKAGGGPDGLLHPTADLGLAVLPAPLRPALLHGVLLPRTRRHVLPDHPPAGSSIARLPHPCWSLRLVGGRRLLRPQAAPGAGRGVGQPGLAARRAGRIRAVRIGRRRGASGAVARIHENQARAGRVGVHGHPAGGGGRVREGAGEVGGGRSRQASASRHVAATCDAVERGAR